MKTAAELLQALTATVASKGGSVSVERGGRQGLAILSQLQAKADRQAEKEQVSASDALKLISSMEKVTDIRTEAQRILDVPAWDPENFEVPDMTPEFAIPGGTMKLKPIQSLALYWMKYAGGLLAPLAVGGGKTLISLLAPLALGSQRPLLLIPPMMQLPLRREIEKYKKHFRMPKKLIILPYSILSQASSTDLLGGDRPGALFPDLIIADEAHSLRYMTASRTKRIARYFQRYPETKFVAMSGTLTSRGLADYAHLAELALRDKCPMPTEARELLAWANCLDAGATARPQDWSLFNEFCNLDHIDDEVTKIRAAREAFRQRLISTPGVVATKEGSVEASIILRRRDIDMPGEVTDALRELNNTWQRPDGEELVTALEKWRVAQQLVQGFYYYWDWPNGEVDHEWMDARSWWRKEVRQILQANQEGLDSPLLVRNAVMEGRLVVPSAGAAWYAWSLVKDRPPPPVATTWISDYVVNDAVQWLKEKGNEKGLVWYSDRAIAAALMAKGVETYGGGEDPPIDGRPMALSIDAHGAGLNLQKHHKNLILSFPSSGKTAEQLLGRTHRYGQEADEVLFDYYAPCPEAMDNVIKARRDARYIQQTQGSPQKLCYASWVNIWW